MTTRNEIRDLISARLGNRGSGFDTQIETEIKFAQVEQEAFAQLPWFLINYDTSQATAANTKTITIPTDFLMEDDYTQLAAVHTDGSYRKLYKDDYDSLRTSTFFETNRFPEQYAIVGDTVFFFPTPDAAYSLDWHYYKKATVLSSNAENSWLANAPGVLLNKAGMQMARFLRDANAIGIFTQDYGMALKQMYDFDEARRQAAMKLEMGG